MAEPDTSQMSGSKKRKQSREKSYIDSSNIVTEKRKRKKATTMNTGYISNFKIGSLIIPSIFRVTYLEMTLHTFLKFIDYEKATEICRNHQKILIA